MHPRQKLRLVALAVLLGYGALIGLQVIEGPIHRLPLGIFNACMLAVLIGGIVYMLRQREELRDHPEQQERQRQWGLKHGPAVLNGMLALYLICAVAAVLLLYGGHVEARQAIVMKAGLVACLPGILIVIWVRIKLAAKLRQQKNGNSG